MQQSPATRESNGDEFEEAFDLHAPRLLGFALRLTGNRAEAEAEAEDLVQETFLAAFSGHDALRARSKYLPWLLGIAARRWRDRCRKSDLATVPLIEEQDDGAGREHEGAQASPEDQVVAAMTLEGALCRLSPALRESLLLVASQGLSYKEAALALGEPVGTVKWRVWEASRRMREMLSQIEEEYHDQARPQAPSTAGAIAEPAREMPAPRAGRLARGRSAGR